MKRPGEPERCVVVVGYCFAEAITAAQPLDAKDQRRGRIEIGVAHELAVKVELPASRRSKAVGYVRLACRLDS